MGQDDSPTSSFSGVEVILFSYLVSLYNDYIIILHFYVYQLFSVCLLVRVGWDPGQGFHDGCQLRGKEVGWLLSCCSLPGSLLGPATPTIQEHHCWKYFHSYICLQKFRYCSIFGFDLYFLFGINYLSFKYFHCFQKSKHVMGSYLRI